MTEDIRLDSLEGVGPVTTKKLSGAGVHSIMDLIVRGPVEIADITGMEKDTADRIVNKAREHLEDYAHLQVIWIKNSSVLRYEVTIIHIIIKKILHLCTKLQNR